MSDLPVPSEGGSYLRDDETGALTRVDAPPAETTPEPQAEEPPADPAPDAPETPAEEP